MWKSHDATTLCGAVNEFYATYCFLDISERLFGILTKNRTTLSFLRNLKNSSIDIKHINIYNNLHILRFLPNGQMVKN